MFKALFLLQLQMLKNQLTAGMQNRKPNSAGRTVVLVLLFLYVIGAFEFLFYTYFNVLAEPLHDAGASWLYFVFLIVLAFALMFIGSVFTAKAQLFEAKDNEFLLSMPVPPKSILSARLVALLLLNFVFELLVAIGGLLPWFSRYSLPAVGTVSLVVILLALPFFSLAISSLFGWLLALVTQRIRRKSLFSLVLSLLFLGAYFYGMTKINSAISELVANLSTVADTLGAITPLYWMGCAIADGQALSLLLSVLILLIPFVLVFLLLAATFIKTATTQHGVAKIRYVDRGQKVSSPFRALVQKEMSPFHLQRQLHAQRRSGFGISADRYCNADHQTRGDVGYSSDDPRDEDTDHTNDAAGFVSDLFAGDNLRFQTLR